MHNYNQLTKEQRYQIFATVVCWIDSDGDSWMRRGSQVHKLQGTEKKYHLTPIYF
jgi:hypothetical protein